LIPALTSKYNNYKQV